MLFNCNRNVDLKLQTIYSMSESIDSLISITMDSFISVTIRGVSDVGFSIFADTDADADFAF